MFPLLTSLAHRNPPGVNFIHATCDLLLLGLSILFQRNYSSSSFLYCIDKPRSSQPARREFHPRYVRPVAARLVDSFLKKVTLQVIFVVELTNLAYFNSLGLSIHFLKNYSSNNFFKKEFISSSKPSRRSVLRMSVSSSMISRSTIDCPSSSVSTNE